MCRNSLKPPHPGLLLHGIVEVDWPPLLENTVELAVAGLPSMYRQKYWMISNPPESQQPDEESCCWK